MQKKEAAQLIESTFNQAFDEARFTLFIKNLLNDVDTNKRNEYSGNLIKDAYKEHVSSYKRIGKYIDPDGEAMDVLIVKLHDQSKLDKARTALRNFVITHLDSFEKDYALVAYYSASDGGADWRFSYVKLEYRTEVKGGKIKQRKELTPAKRYSFLVGEHEKAYTAKSQLLPLLQNVYNNPTLEQLEGAFSIETVTDEFFEQYKLLFGKLVEQFEKDTVLQTELSTSNIETTRFAKKLLGQIVFLYFLQKKGWLGVDKTAAWGTGDRRFLQSLFDKADNQDVNYFGEFLQPLFYEALAKEHQDEGVNGYYSRLNSRIPFLNGGLFEADYNWSTANITIPNTLFRNDEVLKSGDLGTGILDVFDRYNFTIKEDEPLEKEVAVDPEMLGKVFENMLEVTERKSKGAFYTPREIVHYMCQESLIHYLDNSINNYAATYQELGNGQLAIVPPSKKGQQLLAQEHTDIKVPKHDLEEFIRKGFFALENDQRVISEGKETKTYKFQLPETVRTHADALDHYIADIKICDPAIGSGAFPVGLLLELVNAQLVLRQYLSPAYFEKKLNTLGLTKAQFEANETRYTYRLKRHTIQESIYGVDIDASAIDVARLRLWLSLVVDEEDLDNIEALPNLDYKIVCGNSLIGLPEGYEPRWLDELEDIKEQFFICSNNEEKIELRNQINEKLYGYLENSKKSMGYHIDFDYKLFFSEVWREKGGFDVVIGNPPYIKVQNLEMKQKEIFKKLYVSATKSYDIYVLFDERGHKLLNNHGYVTFIQPNKFFNADYGIGIRNYIANTSSLKSVVDFQFFQVFSTATTYTCIFSLTKRVSKTIEYITFHSKEVNKQFFELSSGNKLKTLVSHENADFLKNESWVFASKIQKNIFETLEKKNNSLSFYAKKIFVGLQTNADPIYILEKRENGFYSKFLNEIIQLENGFLKPLLKGSEIRRYAISNLKFHLILPYNAGLLIDEVVLQDEYPLTYAYLKKCEKALREREKGKMNHQNWYAFVYPKNLELFDSLKIMTQVLANKASMVVDESKNHYFVGGGNAGGYGITLKDNTLDYYYLVSLLNSSALDYYLQGHSSKFQNGYYSYAKRFIEKLPIKNIDKSDQELFITLSRYIHFLKKIERTRLYETYLEQCLDSAVFELYFQKELKKAGKEILKHLQDLQPITDEMSEEEKLAIIRQEFERLYDPNHPVRNAVETLDSVEEVRIIREALQK